jgi:hypothetical protein
MDSFSNAMEIFRLLEKSNCGKCGEKTCLAFAARVFRGDRVLGDCPQLPETVAKNHPHAPVKRVSQLEKDQEAMIAGLKQDLLPKDFSALAQKVGGEYKNGRLSIQVLGKPVSVDEVGGFFSDIHLNPWVVLSVLRYLLNCRGLPLSGRWVPFRELLGARERAALFAQGAVKPLQRIADAYPDLFRDLAMIFKGKPVPSDLKPDLALVLPLLPKLPLMLCYWQPDEGMESELRLLFDETAVENSGIETIFGLGQGIARMFEKIFINQGWRDLAQARRAAG